MQRFVSPRAVLRARASRLLLCLLATTALVAGTTSAMAAEEKPSTKQAPVDVRHPGLVDINAATEKELESLPHIGPALAKRIVEYRKTAGSFKKVDELLNVKGIGEKSLETIRPFVTVGSQTGGKS